MAKPLDPPTRHAAAETLRALADELTADHAGRTQQLIGTEAAIGYPKRASGTPGAPGNQTDEHGNPTQPDTPTEAAALNPDPTAAAARILLFSQHQTLWDAADLLRQLQTRNPSRTIKVCPRCQHPITAGRCQQRDEDGRLCGSTPDAWPLCLDCAEPMAPNDRTRGRHRTCDQYRRRHGYGRAGTAAMIHQIADMITDEGVHHAG